MTTTSLVLDSCFVAGVLIPGWPTLAPAIYR
jgi:hypothetical protein